MLIEDLTLHGDENFKVVVQYFENCLQIFSSILLISIRKSETNAVYEFFKFIEDESNFTL